MVDHWRNAPYRRVFAAVRMLVGVAGRVQIGQFRVARRLCPDRSAGARRPGRLTLLTLAAGATPARTCTTQVRYSARRGSTSAAAAVFSVPAVRHQMMVVMVRGRR